MSVKIFDSKFYDADKVNIKIGSFLVQGGYADGEFLTFEMDGNDADDVTGTDGETTISISNNRNGVATLKMMQTADINPYLSAQRQLMLDSGPIAAMFPIDVTDLLTGEFVRSGTNYVQKLPSMSFDRTAKSREWPIRVINARARIGAQLAFL